MRTRERLRQALWFATAGLALLLAVRSAEAAKGVVVEEVAPGFGGQVAGVAPGDVVVSWSRAPRPPANPRGAHGSIRSAFELLEVEVEQGPRGIVTLSGRRGAAKARWTLPLDEWRLTVRPQLAPARLAGHEDARRLLTHDQPLDAAARWEQEATHVAPRDPALAAWLLLRGGEAAGRAREWTRADALYARAVALLDDPRRRGAAALALSAWTETFVRRAAWKDVRERYAQAIEALKETPESLAVARLMRLLADTPFGDEVATEKLYRRALALREQLAPESGAVADSLTVLGRLAARQGDTTGAATLLTRSVRLRETLSSGGQPLAVDLTTLARTLALSGDYPTASAHIERALALLERLAPKSAEIGYSLSVAGLIALQTGDLASAERYHRRCLEVYQSLAPDGLNVASALRALSTVAWTRRDFPAAESRAQEALAILERKAPGTSQVGEILHQLGDISLAGGDLATAERELRRALALDQSLAPDGARVANDLRCLSLALVRSGRADEAEPHALRSADIRKRLAPNGLALSQSLAALGEIALRAGRFEAAEARYQGALAITTRFVPGSRQEVEAQYGLGQVYRKAGRLAEAAAAFGRAVDAVERQRTRLGGTDDARTSFSAAYADCYQQAMEVLVELRQPEAAFRVLERSRARALLDLLGERPLLFSADLTPALARERQVNQTTYDRVQAQLESLDPEKDRARSETLVARLRALREQSVEITDQLRTASPRLASLQHPEPCDLRAAQAAFESDGVFVAYAVGQDRTLMFVVEPDGAHGGSGLSVFTIPAGEAALRERVAALRGLITLPYGEDRELRAHAEQMYDELLRPAEDALSVSRRVAISPDGPLHLLPFAALRRRDSQDEKAPALWLGQWRPLHIVASASHYAELRKSRREPTPSTARLVAFGDPLYSADATASTSVGNAELRLARAQAERLGSLPGTRAEVEAIAALFGGRAVTYLGQDATEARVKAGLGEFSYIHFACHGLLDEQRPLHSALVLSLAEPKHTGEDNGLLQIWEIFDSVRLDAELVTLSACNTALGRDARGEGLQGLTRAFQYAGARSVLASLWNASDRATADLMVHLYRALQRGKPKVEALQDAQAALIRAGAPPFHWATFEIFGDWR